MEEIYESLHGEIFGVWFLIGAALVFWMQAGFAMVEAGFTRAKNTGNIIMKNLMDFCIGTVMFIAIGFGLLLGEDAVGLIGTPGFDIFSNYSNFPWSSFIFNLVFCATTATIVSGAMAERTKFLSYCVYSAIISGIIYPIEAHWIWGTDITTGEATGWLVKWGFHDFAGSCAIHMVGGIAALIGAKILGPRIGKFDRDEKGKVVKVNAFPGHNLTIGALGVFILWLGWYGFNGAAATSVDQLASIFVTTTIAPAFATMVCMIFSWIRYGKPDVSMCLNASLAGLVAITASCDVTDAFGAIIIGSVAGLLVVFGVWLLDYVLHIDDPVGAVAVHCLNGIWGTIAVGLFATKSAPSSELKGLFYGGGVDLLVKQLVGMVCVIGWTAVTMFIVFFAIKKIFGLRVTREEEIVGLDIMEHGLETAYAGFAAIVPEVMTTSEKTMKKVTEDAAPSVEEAIPVMGIPKEVTTTASDIKLSKVDIICKMEKFEVLKEALNKIGIMGITVTNVMGCGTQKGASRFYRGVEVEAKLLPKVKLEVVVSKVPVDLVVNTARKALYTGNIGDGKIFVYGVENVIKVRTGETGVDALQNIEEQLS